MENIEKQIEESKKVLMNGTSLLTILDNLYYKKGYDKIKKFSHIHDTVDHFKDSLDLLKTNLVNLNNDMKINSNMRISIFSQITKLAQDLDSLDLEGLEENISVYEEPKDDNENLKTFIDSFLNSDSEL